MYRIYTTDAFVLSSQPAAEASLKVSLFTEELGLVRAHAQGVRLVGSKLRSGLQTLHRSNVSLVRGREFWRLTSAMSYEQSDWKFEQRTLFARLLALVERLVHGEEQDGELYGILVHLHALLARESFTADELRQLELLALLQILDHLGYVGGEQQPLSLFKANPLEKQTLALVTGKEGELLSMVNASLHATQL